jgi:hypothetical protein
MVGYLSTCVFCASERGRPNARDRKLVLAEKTQEKKRPPSRVIPENEREDAAVVTRWENARRKRGALLLRVYGENQFKK